MVESEIPFEKLSAKKHPPEKGGHLGVGKGEVSAGGAVLTGTHGNDTECLNP